MLERKLTPEQWEAKAQEFERAKTELERSKIMADIFEYEDYGRLPRERYEHIAMIGMLATTRESLAALKRKGIIKVVTKGNQNNSD